MKETQTEAILADMRQGMSVTALDALNRYGCFRLAARINDIRKLGHVVHVETVEVAGGKRVARYWMDQPEQLSLF